MIRTETRAAAFAANAPLMPAPDGSQPDGGKGDWYRGAGGLRLRSGYFQAPGAVRGTVFLSTGRAEAIESYYETIGEFLARGFCVVIHDWRGQGLSARLLPERLKCHARTADEFLDDFERLCAFYEEIAPKPWVMVGHAMGGLLNLLSLVRGELRFSGAFLLSPLLRVRTGKRAHWSVKMGARFKVKNGYASNYVFDDFPDPFEESFDDAPRTHDRRRFERWKHQLYACPHLALASITWGWLNFALEAGEKALKAKLLKRVRTPITLVQAGDDVVTQKAFAKLAAKRLPDVRYIELAQARHDLLHEVDEVREQVFEAFDSFADQVAPMAEGDQRPIPAPRRAPEIENFATPSPAIVEGGYVEVPVETVINRGAEWPRRN